MPVTILQTPRTTGGNAYTHLARSPGIAVSGMDGPLFMAGKDVEEFRL